MDNIKGSTEPIILLIGVLIYAVAAYIGIGLRAIRDKRSGCMIAPAEEISRRGKSELYRAGWFVTRTPGDRGKVPQKTNRLKLSGKGETAR